MIFDSTYIKFLILKCNNLKLYYDKIVLFRINGVNETCKL